MARRPTSHCCARSPGGRSSASRSTTSSGAGSTCSPPPPPRCSAPPASGRSPPRACASCSSSSASPRRRACSTQPGSGFVYTRGRLRRIRRVRGRMDDVDRPRHARWPAFPRASPRPSRGSGAEPEAVRAGWLVIVLAARWPHLGPRARGEARCADLDGPGPREDAASAGPDRGGNPRPWTGTACCSVPTPAATGFGETALLLLFAYAGFENTAAPAGEFKNPAAGCPFALLVMIAGVTMVYTLVQLVALGVVPDLAQLGHAAGRRRRDPPGPLRCVASHDRRRALRSWERTATPCSRARAISMRWPSRAACPRAGRASTPASGRPGSRSSCRPRSPSRSRSPEPSPAWQPLSVVARMATYVGTAAAVPVLRRKMPATARGAPARRPADPHRVDGRVRGVSVLGYGAESDGGSDRPRSWRLIYAAGRRGERTDSAPRI